MTTALGNPSGPLVLRNGRLVPREQADKEQRDDLQTTIDRNIGQTDADVVAASTTPNVPAAAPGPVQATPPAPTGPVTQSQSQSARTRTIISDNERKAFEASQALQQSAVDLAKKQGELDRQTAVVQADQARENARVNAELRAQEQATQEQITSDLKSKTDEAEQLVQQIRDFKPYTRQDFWADRTTGQRVMATIGIALSSFSNAMLGRPGFDSVSGMIEKAIDRDIDAQKQQLAVKIETLNQVRAQHGMEQIDGEQALRALEVKRIGAKEAAADQYAVAAAERGIQQAQIQQDQNILQLRQAANSDRQRFFENERVQVTRQVQSRTVEGGAAGGGAVDGAVFDANGRAIANVGDKQRANKINEANAAYRNLRETLADLERNIREHGNEINPWSQAMSDRNVLNTRGMALTNRIWKLGAMDKGTQEILDKAFGAGMAAGITGAEARIKKSRESMEQDHKNFLNSSGLPASQFFGPMTAPSTVAPTGPQPQPAPRSQSQNDLQAAAKWLRENPSDPRAPAVRARLAAQVRDGLRS